MEIKLNIFFKKIFLFFYIFLFIFNPTVFANFNLMYLLILIATINLIKNWNNFKKIIMTKYVLAYLGMLIYLILYLLILSIKNLSDAFYEAYNYSLVFGALLCGVYIIVELKKLYILNWESLNYILFIIFSIQLLFIILTLISNDFRNWILITSRFENLKIISEEFNAFRSYGLANGFTSTFPMALGLFSLLLIGNYYYKSLCINYFDLKYNLIFLLTIIGIVLNGRIGLFPFLLFLIIFSVFKINNLRFLKLIWKLLMFFIISILFIIFLELDIEIYLKRFTWGFNEFLELLSGNVVGTFETLLVMIHFPTDINTFLFGSGIKVFGNSQHEFSSDIGFIRDIYMFGVLNLVLLFFIVIYFSIPLVKTLNFHYSKIFTIIFFISFLVFYLKGSTWSSSELHSLFILLSLFSISSKQNFKNRFIF